MMSELSGLFSAGSLYSSEGGASTTILNGHVFLRAQSSAVEKEIAVNLCARIGFDVVGYDLPILKIYAGEECVQRPVNIFINCGPFAPATGEGIAWDTLDGCVYVTLYGRDMEALREKGAELYSFCAKKKDASQRERASSPISNDLAGITTINGLFADRDGDLLADELLAEIVIEDHASDVDIIDYAHLAARLAGETTELCLPMSFLRSRARGEGAPTVSMNESASIAYHPSSCELRLGHRATDYFLKSFPYFDRGKSFHLDEAADWLRRQSSRMDLLPRKTVFDIEKTLDVWEVDELMEWVRAELLEAVTPADDVEILAAVSEGKELRRQIERDIVALFQEKGLKAPAVRVICGFKQGLSFIEECVLPQVAAQGEDIGEIRIGFRPLLQTKDQEWDTQKGARPTYGDYSKEKKWFDLPIRWLQELYPVDDIIARTLGISRDVVTFEPLDFEAENTYEVTVKDKKGAVLLTKSLELRTLLTDYLQAYSLGFVHIVQGFAQASVGGKIIAQRAIRSDLERFWAEYQAILQTCRDHIVAQGRARQEAQPFFKCLRVEVFASEPDYALDCRQDLISSLDALHEDIYFTGLDFFRRFGEEATGSVFAEPGLILPVVHKREGQAAGYRIILTEETRRADAAPLKIHLEKLDIAEGIPHAMHFSTDRAREGLLALKKFIEAEAERVDFPFVGEFVLNGVDASSVPIKINGAPENAGRIDARKALRTIEDHVIGYEESLELLNGLRGHDGVNVVKIATSLEGRSIYAVELFEKLPVEITSHVKRVATKPAFFLNNRHHANEVSSTNSAFRLIFKCLDDPEYQKYVRATNLIVVPLENVDGTAIGYELQRENQNWILHAARYNSMGRDFYFDYFSDKPGECQGLPRIWRKWLPDFIVDNHGVPSHEWSQPFSGYVSPWFRGFWLPRALFYGYCMYVDDPRYPQIRSYFELVAKKVSEELDRDEAILSASLDWKDRHTRYAHRFMPNMYPQDYVGNWIYYFEGVPHNPKNFHPHIRYPWITTMEWITEIADETAQGEYLELCSRAHAIADLAVIRLLSGVMEEVEEYSAPEEGRVRLVKRRARPVKIASLTPDAHGAPA